MIKITERGWVGHFIGGNRCRFRRNTLIEKYNIKIVVSTVGLMEKSDKKGFDEIGNGRYYETMVFHALNDKYCDADVTRDISVDSKWAIYKADAEIEANNMHDTIVNEIIEKIKKGIFDTCKN